MTNPGPVLTSVSWQLMSTTGTAYVSVHSRSWYLLASISERNVFWLKTFIVNGCLTRIFSLNIQQPNVGDSQAFYQAHISHPPPPRQHDSCISAHGTTVDRCSGVRHIKAD